MGIVLILVCINKAMALKDSIATLDAKMLKRATKGIGTDERLVVSILCARSKSQLEAVDQKYRQLFDKTLVEFIKGEMGGNLAKFLLYTQMSEEEFDSNILHDAFSGLGTNESRVLEVLCTRTYDRLQQAK